MYKGILRIISQCAYNEAKLQLLFLPLMNLEYGPEFDELAMCFKYLDLDINYICIEENKLRLDNEEKTIATLLTSINEHFDKELFDAECISLIQKIAKMNINAFKTFYSNLAKTKNTCNENNNEEAKLPFYANKKSMSIIDIYLFARTYRFLYSNTFDASVMEYFEILNKMMHEKLNTRLFTDFEYLDIRAGKIVQIHEHPEADKLFVETVLFNEQKVIVSGLREHFKKENLLNRHFLFLVNLKKNKLKGVVSEGMILCAKNEKLEVLESPIEMPNTSVSTKGNEVIREVTKSILDSGKDKFKNIMKNLTVKAQYLCYNGEVLNIQGKEIKVVISDAIVS